MAGQIQSTILAAFIALLCLGKVDFCTFNRRKLREEDVLQT